MSDTIETYDVYVLSMANASIASATWRAGWQSLTGSLEQARRAAQDLRSRGLIVVVAPSRYAQPQVTAESALAIASRELETLRTGRRDLSTLGPLEDDVVWWTFEVDDLLAQEEGFVPGTLRIAIDKIDGHVATSAEMSAFYALSADPPASRPHPG